MISTTGGAEELDNSKVTGLLGPGALRVIALARIVLRLLADLAGLVVLSLRPRRSVEAENLCLRRELALCQERGVKPRRVDAATGLLAVLSRLFDWRVGAGRLASRISAGARVGVIE